MYLDRLGRTLVLLVAAFTDVALLCPWALLTSKPSGLVAYVTLLHTVRSSLTLWVVICASLTAATAALPSRSQLLHPPRLPIPPTQPHRMIARDRIAAQNAAMRCGASVLRLSQQFLNDCVRSVESIGWCCQYELKQTVGPFITPFRT
jgi:hypothetical protein